MFDCLPVSLAWGLSNRGLKMDWKYLFTSFQGRINRKPFWLALIALTVISMVAFGVVSAIFGTFTPTGDAGSYSMNFSPIGWVFMAVLYIALLWAGLAIGVKRLHDRNRSGWFYLLMLVPILNIWMFVEIYFLRGTVGTNRYGDDPLAGQ